MMTRGGVAGAAGSSRDASASGRLAPRCAGNENRKTTDPGRGRQRQSEEGHAVTTEPGDQDVTGTGGQGDLAQAVLEIEGMHCGSCSALIEETLVEDLGVASAHVDLEARLATVTFDPSVHSVTDLCDAVAAAGYRAAAVEP